LQQVTTPSKKEEAKKAKEAKKEITTIVALHRTRTI